MPRPIHTAFAILAGIIVGYRLRRPEQPKPSEGEYAVELAPFLRECLVAQEHEVAL